MIQATIGGPLYYACEAAGALIDGIAEVITGDREHFWIRLEHELAAIQLKIVLIQKYYQFTLNKFHRATDICTQKGTLRVQA
jgi:hypothetical protein